MELKALAAILLAGFVLTVPAFSQESSNRLIPCKAFFTGNQRTGFQSVQNGEYLFFKSTESGSQIRYVVVKQPDQVQILETGKPIASWRPTSDGVVFLYREDESQKIGLVSLQGAVSEFKAAFPMKTASFLAAFPNNANQFVLSIVGEKDADSGIYVFDWGDRTLTKRCSPQPFASLFFDGELNPVAASDTKPGGGDTFYLFDRETEKWDAFLEHPWSMDVSMLRGFSKILSVSRNGKFVYFTSNRDSDKTRLFRIDVESKRITKLAEHEQVDLLPYGFSLNQSGDVTSVVGLFAKTIRVVTDPGCQEDFDRLDRMIPGDIGFMQSCNNDQLWFIREFSGGPEKVYMFDRATKELSELITDWPHLREEVLSPRHAFEVKTRDGLTLPVHVYLPAGSDENEDGIPDRPLPTVMYVHGGPWAGIVHWNQNFHWRNFQLLANRGYAVINCEFRGSVGMGKEFVESARKSWATKMTLDKVDIAQWAIDSRIAAKDKVAIWGWSYGGYAALAGLAFSPDTYACGISMYGISDLAAFGKTDFANNEFWHDWVGDPFSEEDIPMLKSASPINGVEQIKSPVLLTTGGKDRRVLQSQVDKMAKALADAGKDVTYFYYPNEVHDYRQPESWISFWAVSEKFLSIHLGGRCESTREDFDAGDFVIVNGQMLFDSIKEKHRKQDPANSHENSSGN